MNPSSLSILNVETDPGFRHLLSMIMVDMLGLKVEEACSPEEGLERVKKSLPFSIFWCGEQFEGSNIDGVSFLRICRNESPVSSRILCSDSLENKELHSLLKAGDIHSFCSKENIKSVDSISGPIGIGIEYHKINLCGEFFDIADLTRPGQLDVDLRRLVDVLEGFENKKGWGLREGELAEAKLLHHTRSILEKSKSWISRQNSLLKKIKSKEESLWYATHFNWIHETIAELEAHLNKSNQYLKKSIELVKERDIKIAEMKIKIKELKDKFREQ